MFDIENVSVEYAKAMKSGNYTLAEAILAYTKPEEKESATEQVQEHTKVE